LDLVPLIVALWGCPSPFDELVDDPLCRHAWGSPRCSPIAPRKAFPSLSERSRSTGIWPRPHAYIGLAKNFVGCGEETAGHIEDALRLSPRDTAAYLWRSFAGSVKLFLGKNEETVALLRHPIETNRNFALPHFYLAVALAELGPGCVKTLVGLESR
jgi:hypothetical protein